MRVITGDAKGHRLKSRPGLSTRPTTDLVRGAIFSILGTTAKKWSLVLDLYAGTGALGIEALSEGAGRADFVERNAKCCDIIRHNLKATGLTDRARVYCCHASKFLSRSDNKYDVVFLDPPYSDPSATKVVETLTKSDLVGINTTIVIQYSHRMPLMPSYNGFELVKDRCYGDTCISFYQMRNNE